MLRPLLSVPCLLLLGVEALRVHEAPRVTEVVPYYKDTLEMISGKIPESDIGKIRYRTTVRECTSSTTFISTISSKTVTCTYEPTTGKTGSSTPSSPTSHSSSHSSTHAVSTPSSTWKSSTTSRKPTSTSKSTSEAHEHICIH